MLIDIRTEPSEEALPVILGSESEFIGLCTPTEMAFWLFKRFSGVTRITVRKIGEVLSMSNTKEHQDFVDALQNYAEKLVVEAYARTTKDADEDLSDEVLTELADTVERQLIVQVTKVIESVANSVESTTVGFVQPID